MPELSREALRRRLISSLWELRIEPPYSDQFNVGEMIILISVLPPGADPPDHDTARTVAHECAIDTSSTQSSRECETAILALMADIGGALTTKEIRAELKLRGHLFGEGVVKHTLARMVRAKRLTNSMNKLGYRLVPNPP